MTFYCNFRVCYLHEAHSREEQPCCRRTILSCHQCYAHPQTGNRIHCYMYDCSSTRWAREGHVQNFWPRAVVPKNQDWPYRCHSPLWCVNWPAKTYCPQKLPEDSIQCHTFCFRQDCLFFSYLYIPNRFLLMCSHQSNLHPQRLVYLHFSSQSYRMCFSNQMVQRNEFSKNWANIYINSENKIRTLHATYIAY